MDTDENEIPSIFDADIITPDPAIDAGRDHSANTTEEHLLTGSNIDHDYQPDQDTDPYEGQDHVVVEELTTPPPLASSSKENKKRNYIGKRKRGRSTSSSSSSDSSPSRSPKRKTKKSKRRKKVERSSSSSSSADSSSSTSSSSSDDSDTRSKRKKKRKHKRRVPSKHFSIKSKKDLNKWGIRKNMAKHINKHSRQFIKDADIQKHILDIHPVPANIKETPILDPILRSSLLHNNKDIAAKKDNSLKRAQNKIRDTLGPLSRVWSLIEDFRESKEKKKLMDVASVGEALEQTNILLGQAQVSILYIRRMNVLSSLAGHKEAKRLIQENSKLLEEETSDNELLGPQFRKHLEKIKKEEKKQTILFSSPPRPQNKAPPFRGGPPQATGSGGQTHTQKGQGSFRSRRPNRGKKVTFTKTFIGKPDRNREHKSSPPGPKSIPSNEKKITTGGKTKALCKSLESDHKRQRNPEHSAGMGNKVHRKPHSKKGSPKQNDRVRTTDYLSRNRNNVEKGGHRSSTIRGRTSPFKSISKRKEGQVIKTDTKPEGPKRVHPLRTLQDGRTKGCEKPNECRRLVNKNRPKGCIFLGSPKQKIGEICQVPLERNNISVPLSLFRSGPSTTTVYKTNESPHITPTENEHKISNLPGRHSHLRLVDGGNLDSKGHGNIPSRESGVCNKLQKICHKPNEDSGISGDNNRQCVHDNVPNRGENNVSIRPMPEDIDFQKVNSERIRKPDRKASRNSTSNNTMHAADQIPATTSNPISQKTPKFRKNSNIRQKFDNGIRLVDRKSTSSQRETNQNISPRHDNLLRCGNLGRLGSNMPGNPNRRTVVTTGEKTPHKSIRNDCSRTSSENIHKTTPPSQTCSLNDRQQNSSSISSKDGRYKEPDSYRHIQESLGLPAIKGDHSYSRIPPIRAEHSRRLPVSECKRLERMETRTNNIQSNLCHSRGTRHGSICIPHIPSNKPIYEFETRSTMPSSRCTTTKLDPSFPICLSSIQPNRESPEEGTGSTNQYDNYHPHLGDATLVPNIIGNVNTSANSPNNASRDTSRSRGRLSPTCPKQVSQTRSLVDLGTELENQKISTRAADLITKSRTLGTRHNYNSTWQKFSGWCSERYADPVHCHLNYILDFLSELFEKGLQYRTINGYRSAISAYHHHIGGKPAGENPKVCSLMKGVSNERPPTPRYCSVWDVGKVLDHIKTFGGNKSLSIKNLTLKLTFLLAITSAHRGSELKHLKVHCMDKYNEVIIFQFDTKLKNSKQGKKLPKSEFHRFKGDPDLCPVECLNTYLDISNKWRSKDENNIPIPSQLLLSHIKPHETVTKPTIARWLKDILSLAGINTGIYKAHSTRAAASSKAESMGLPIEEIISKGNWTSKSMFQKFYHKPIEYSGKNFQQKVVSKKPL